MSLAASCTEEDVSALVHQFYQRVRADAELGSVFDRHIDDWTPHLAKMVDFWSAALRGTSRYRGTPMQAHARLPELSEALFARWLALFRATAAGLPNAAMAERAVGLAERIAESLWIGYAMRDRLPILPRAVGVPGEPTR